MHIFTDNMQSKFFIVIIYSFHVFSVVLLGKFLSADTCHWWKQDFLAISEKTFDQKNLSKNTKLKTSII